MELCRLTPLYNTGRGSRLSAMAYSPYNSHYLGLASSKYCSLIDVRYPRKPVVEWDYGNIKDPCVGLSFIRYQKEGKGSFVYIFRFISKIYFLKIVYYHGIPNMETSYYIQ
jgi:hypothetical protein